MKQSWKKTSSRLLATLAVCVMLSGLLVPSAAALSTSTPDDNHLNNAATGLATAQPNWFTDGGGGAGGIVVGNLGCKPMIDNPSKPVAESGDLITIPFINYNMGNLALASKYTFYFNVTLVSGQTLTDQDITDLTNGTIFTWWLDWKSTPRAGTNSHGTTEKGPCVISTAANNTGTRIGTGIASILFASKQDDIRYDEFDIKIQLTNNLPAKYNGAKFAVEVVVAATQGDMPGAHQDILGGNIVPLTSVTPAATLDLAYNRKTALTPVWFTANHSVRTQFILKALAETETHNIYINYYNDSISGTLVGQESVLSVQEGDNVLDAIVTELGSNWLNKYKGANRNNGVLDASTPVLVTDVMENGDIYLKVIYTVDPTNYFTITILYFDAAVMGPPLGTEYIEQVSDGSNILNVITNSPLGAGWLDAYRSSGYSAGVLDITTPLQSTDVINGANVTLIVLYTALPVTHNIYIDYYNDSISGTWLGQESVLNVKEGDNVLGAIAADQGSNWLNTYKETYRNNGQLDGATPMSDTTVMGTGDIYLKVYYTIDLYSIKVEYYNDSISTTSIGAETIASVPNGSNIQDAIMGSALGANWLNAYKDTDRNNGALDSTTPLSASDTISGNVTYKVVYSIDTFTITILYYNDSISTTSIGAETIASVPNGSNIQNAIAAALGANWRDVRKAAERNAGVLDSTTPLSASDTISDNVTYKVVYSIDTFTITILYYNDSISTTPIGTETITSVPNGSDIISVITNWAQSANWLDAYKDTYRNAGLLDLTTPLEKGDVIDGANVTLKVVYGIEKYTITILYYNDNISTMPIGTETIALVPNGSNIQTTITGSALGSTWLNKYKAAARNAGVLDSTTPLSASDTISGNVTYKVVYSIDTFTITILYYNDSISTTSIGTETIASVPNGSNIQNAIAAALGANWRDLRKAAARNNGVLDSTTPLSASDTISGNVTYKVVYGIDTFAITILYYNDSVLTTPIGTETIASVPNGSNIQDAITAALGANWRDLRKAAERNAGVLDSTTPLSASDKISGNVTYKVVYGIDTFAITILYYNDSVLTTPIGTETIASVPNGSNIQDAITAALGANWRDLRKAAERNAGVLDSTTPLSASDKISGNVTYKVVYGIDTFAITILYYNDSVLTTPIGTETIASVPNGSNIQNAIAAALGANWRDLRKAAERNAGVLDSTTPLSASDTISGNATYKVVYSIDTFTITILYYNDSISTTPIGTETIASVPNGSSIQNAIAAALGANWRDLRKAAERNAGVLDSTTPLSASDTISGNATYKVVYSIDTFTITILYYNDSISTTPIGTETITSVPNGSNILNTITGSALGVNWLDAYKETYRNSGALDATTPLSASDTISGDVTYKVVYGIDTFTITIEYYKEIDEDGNRTLIADEKIIEVPRGSDVLETIKDKLGEEWIDLYLDPAYNLPGAIDPATPLESGNLIDDNVTIIVVYPHKTIVLATYMVTIIYYNDNINTTPLATKDIRGVEENSNLLATITGELGENWVNLYRGAGRNSGTIHSSTPVSANDVVDRHITIRVVYVKPAQTGDAFMSWPLATIALSVLLAAGAVFLKKRRESKI